MKLSEKSLFLILLLVLGQVAFSQAPRRIKVIMDNANIRSKPELDAEILDVAAKGDLLDFIEKAGPWYTIQVGTEPSGKIIYGYIHESMVEPVGAIPPEPQPAPVPAAVPPPPPPTQERPPSSQTSPIVQPPIRLISGSYIKYGFGDHWLLSFGSDFGVAPNFGLGLEFQPSYRERSDIDLSVFQFDIFANAKLGFRVGFLTLYGGGGIGPDFSYTTTKIGDQSTSEFRTMLAYHGIVGVALNAGTISFVFEYQPMMISDPDIESEELGHFFLVGLRF
jgi:hypothetical protein